MSIGQEDYCWKLSSKYTSTQVVGVVVAMQVMQKVREQGFHGIFFLLIFVMVARHVFGEIPFKHVLW
jgi:hypothetical protein